MKLLRAKACAALFDVHHSTWEKWAASDPTAPAPVIKTSGYIVWAEDEVLAYQELLIREGRTGNVKKTA